MDWMRARVFAAFVFELLVSFELALCFRRVFAAGCPQVSHLVGFAASVPFHSCFARRNVAAST